MNFENICKNCAFGNCNKDVNPCYSCSENNLNYVAVKQISEEERNRIEEKIKRNWG